MASDGEMMDLGSKEEDFPEQLCPGCSLPLVEPYIKCAECICYCLCLKCFCKGFESSPHQSDHKYQMTTNDFPVLDSGWSALEELKLLDALSDCGPGNWEAIASQIPTKSQDQCRNHYMKCYVIDAKYPLPDLPNPPVPQQPEPIPFKPCEDPCRPLPESHRAQHMAGYLAARGDLIDEYDNYAEWDMKDVFFDPDDLPLLKQLKIGVVKVYLSRLQERERRKQLIRKIGLINNNNHMFNFTRKLPPKVRDVEESLRPVIQLQKHMIAHDLLIQGLSLEQETAERVERLQKYRRNGITSFRVAKLYDKLKKDRDAAKQQRRLHMSEILPLLHDSAALRRWLHRQVASGQQAAASVPTSSMPSAHKKPSSRPIDLADLPGVEKLSSTEREFCAKSRLVPEAYLQYKAALVHEFHKNGPIRLQAARNVVKIDVNKTRKLYDFLIAENHIEKAAT